jgi:DNA-binding MarR family transcriptional regulator
MERRATRHGARGLLKATWRPIVKAPWFISYWLKRAETQVSRKLASELKLSGLIGSEWAALQEMYRPGRTSSVSLAAVIGMTKGGASKLIDRLVKKGLVRRSVGEIDRRCRPVGLTRRGKCLVEQQLATLANDNEQEFFGQLPTKMRHYLMEALRRVASTGRKPPVYTWRQPVKYEFVPWGCPHAVWGDGS